MNSSKHNVRSDESKAGTSGLRALSLKKPEKRKKSCSTDDQSKRQKIDRERKKSDDEESELGDYRPEKLERSEVYPASGLKSSLHGVAYQLKLLMLFLKRGVDQGYSFCLATEMDAAEKFDDLVFQYEDGKTKVHRLLQAKHKQDETKQISINDLLTDTKKELNLQKYFISYRKIKINPNFEGKIEDVIICTNIDFKWGDEQGEEQRKLTLSDDIFRPKTDNTIFKTDLRQFKEKFPGREVIVSALEDATDLIKLAKNLAGRVLDDEYTKKGKAENTSDDFLKSYRLPLENEVIDGKKFRPEFVEGAESLSQEAKNLRQAIEKVFRDQRKTYNLHTDPVIETKALYQFVKVVAELMEKGEGSKVIKIERRKNVIKENFDKLAWYVLVKKAGKIRFSSAFLNKDKLPGNLDDFREKLLAKLSEKNITFTDIAEYSFNVYKDFQTCDEIYVNLNPKDMQNTFWEVIGEREFDLFDNLSTRNANLESVDVSMENNLPSDTIKEINGDIDSFLDKLVFAVDQPNEEKLGNIIAAEMGKCRGINLINSGFIADKFQSYVFNWMKDKEGRFLTRADGEKFFDEMAKYLTSLQLTWHTQELSERMQQINIRFTKDEMELQEFLEPENKTQLFILSSMPNTILGLIQVHQILKKKPHYQKDDGYIFLGLNSFLLMQGPVIEAFDSPGEHLLIIECKSIEVNDQASYTESLKAMKSNKMKKIILITEKDGTPVNQFKRIFKDRSVEKRVEVKGLIDLTDESREKIINEKSLKFQGQEVALSKLIINEDSMNLINAEALAKLINDETLEIGKCLEDLGDVKNYYISRTLQRPKINQSLMEDGSRFYLATDNQLKGFDSQQNQDIVVISDNDELFKKLSDEEKYEEHNIHWLKSEESHFIWQESKGTVAKLQKFVHSDSVGSFSPEKVTDISNRIVIIAAEPGMGKSTMLTHLSVKTKKSEPTVWVAKVNLSVDCSKKLEKMVDGKITFDHDKTIDFLLAGETFTSEMPEYQFLKNCYKTGNMILLFDGFDEISPHYNEKVIELLKFLKGTKVKKIWVTTRPYDIKNKLEDELGSFSYVLQEFSKGDQKQFLRDFWKAKLELDESNDERANTFIDALLKSFSECIKDCQRKFIGIPLQIKMIAVVFEETSQKCLESDEEDIDGLKEKLKENLELLSLYKNFFEVKFRDIFFGEKQPELNAAASVSRGIMDREREYVVETLEILALENFYPNNSFILRNKVSRLLRDIKEGKNKIGIIDRVVDDKPVFVHKSFAEYFVALWFSKNWQQDNVKLLLKERIFSGESIGIRNFFDRMLANNELQSSESQEFSTEHPASANVYKLHNAVLNNDGSGVQQLLDVDESLFYKTDAAGRSWLHLAAARGHEGIVRSFLKTVQMRLDYNVVIIRTLPLSVTDELFQWTPLSYADKCEHWNVVELFLEMGAAGEDMFEAIKYNVMKRIDYDYTTLLHRAATEDCLKIAKLLLEKGAIIDVCDRKKRTPLHLAAQAGHFRIVKYFISQQNTNLEAVDRYGRTALHLAASEGNLEIVRFLVDEKHATFKTADKLGRTVLHMAAESGNLELVKYFFDEKEVDLEAVDESLCTALHIAAHRGNLETIKYLVDEKNANSEAANASGLTAMQRAVFNEDWEMVKYFFDKKYANFEAADKSGCMALHFAVMTGNLETVKYLVDEKKADLEAVDKLGRTALHFGARERNLETVKYLVDGKNANSKTVDRLGRTAQQMADLRDMRDLLQMVDIWKNSDLLFLVENENLTFGRNFFSQKLEILDTLNKLECTTLHLAASVGNLETVEYLVDEKKADLEAVAKLGRTALHFAASKGNLEIVKYLVDEKTANLKAVDESGYMALHFAAGWGNLETVKYFVDEKKANLKAADNNGCTALHLAISGEKLETVKYLVDEKNADLKAADNNGCTALHLAILRKKLETVKYLVDEKNADLKAVDIGRRTVLHYAASGGNLATVKYLVEEKNVELEAVDASKNTALLLAAFMGNLETVQYLVDDKNANLKAVDESGSMALHFAARSGNLETVKYLVDEKKADLEAVDKLGRTALHFAARRGDLETVKYLVDEKDADLKAVDYGRRTVLHQAASGGNLATVKYLVDEKDADPKAVDIARRTVLHYAASEGNLATVKYLVEEINVELEAVDELKNTALLLAAFMGNLETVKYFVDEKEANLKAADKYGCTALHHAILGKKLETVKYLVDEKDADFEAVDIDRRTVLHYAASEGNLATVKYLVEEINVELEAVDVFKNTALLLAAFMGNLETVKYLVDEKNANFKAVDKAGCTALHVAARAGQLDTVKYLVEEKEVDLKAFDERQRTALDLAESSGRLKVVTYLEEKVNHSGRRDSL